MQNIPALAQNVYSRALRNCYWVAAVREAGFGGGSMELFLKEGGGGSSALSPREGRPSSSALSLREGRPSSSALSPREGRPSAWVAAAHCP